MSTPKKGKAWLDNKLRDRASKRIWREAETTIFEGRGINARLIDTRTKRVITTEEPEHTPSRINEDASTRAGLRASELVSLMSIRLRAVNRNNPRKRILETWLSGSQLQRLVTRTRPSRDGFGHDRYTVLIQFLTREGLVIKAGTGYSWTPDFALLSKRAEWLINTLRSRGEMHTQRESKYALLD